MNEQEKFEAHESGFGFSVSRLANGDYSSSHIDLMYKTWQAAIASREPQWLPIESAPKDGTTIIVGYGHQSHFPVKVVFFNRIHNFWSHYGEADLGLENNATHWMPLPQPPKD